MKRLGIVILTTIVLAGCTSDFAGPVIEPGHPAHPDSPHAMAPAVPSPFNLQPPFLPLAADAEAHDMHMMHGEELRQEDSGDEPVENEPMQHDGHDGHGHGGGGS